MKELVSNKLMVLGAFSVLTIVCLMGAFYHVNNSTIHPAAADVQKALSSGDAAWMLVATALVLLMTPGLAFFYGGMVNTKNIISTMLQSFIALGVISLIWFVVGFSLAFGDDFHGWGIIGNPMTHFMLNNVGVEAHSRMASGIPFMLFCAFQLKFAIITPALISGSFAERVHFWAYIVFISLFSLVIYCPLAHMAWHPDGVFSQWGVLDFAGGTVVHISAGCAALAGALVLGRRQAHVEGQSSLPANIPFVILGTGLLWFGWFGFNAGSALAANGQAVRAFMNTNMASAIAAITWISFDVLKGKKASAVGACVGAVVGLVAITPAAGYVQYGPSLFIGFAAAIISNSAADFFNKTSIDDTLDVFACHGIGGISGMFLTALFAAESSIPGQGGRGLLTTGDPALFIAHFKALLIVVSLAFGGGYLLFKLVALITPLRVDPTAEVEGLDMSQHDETIMV